MDDHLVRMDHSHATYTEFYKTGNKTFFTEFYKTGNKTFFTEFYKTGNKTFFNESRYRLKTWVID
jgi:hypothetical protein